MASLDLQSLVQKLDTSTRGALEAAVALTVSRTHYNVEVEHWLFRLVESGDADVKAILSRFEIEPARLLSDLNKVLDAFKTGNSRSPALAPNVVRLAREAWVFASLRSGDTVVRAGHVIAALVSDDVLASLARDASREIGRIGADELRADFQKIVGLGTSTSGPADPHGGGKAASPVGGSGSALSQYTINLTARARDGLIDPVLGRDAETRQIVDVLTRRRQNNPILTGEAGVGKTAVVEGFALRIASGDVPPSLRDVELLSLDLGLLQAGAGVRGEFENRLKNVIEEVKASTKPIIVFIDEAHTLIGAGGTAGQNDAANLLKPALARGEMRTIAATTWAEYKKYFEKDPALTRRFQVVKVDEPDDEKAIAMMRGLVPTLEHHHGVRILTEAIEDAVRLSRRYIPSRQLPDKAVSLLDTACGRVALARTATPAAVEDRRRRLDMLASDKAALEREAAIGADHQKRLRELEEKRERTASELAALEARWEQESALVAEIREVQASLAEGEAQSYGDTVATSGQEPEERLAPEARRRRLDELRERLEALQGETPLVPVDVDAQAIADVVGAWTGIPVGRMVSDEIKTILELEERLTDRVVGQPQAVGAIAETIRTSRARLTDPRKPIGVFLMVGTSGVGKTETALALAELLYGGEQNLTVINMSEFKEEHRISMLVGSAPGYVGYGEGGVLTEAVRRKPYSVILFDEMEKAHPGVQDVFYQVFDKGSLRDGEGRDIDFKNTLIIMTSNAGTDLIHRLCADEAIRPSASELNEALRPELLKWFKPAFLGRCSVVTYYPLSETIIRTIVGMQLRRIRSRFEQTYGAGLLWDDDLVETVASRCTEVESGARNVEHILSRGLLPRLSARILEILADGGEVGTIRIEAAADGTFTFSDVTTAE